MECKQQKTNSPDQDLSTTAECWSDVPSLDTSKLEDFQADITEQATLPYLKQPVCTHCRNYQLQAIQVYLDFQSYFGLINNHSPHTPPSPPPQSHQMWHTSV